MSLLIIAIAITPGGVRSLAPYCAATHTLLLVPEKLQPVVDSYAAIGLQSQVTSQSLRAVVEAHWKAESALIFALAVGAVTRLIAPLLRDKSTDPAVIVVDEAGQFVVSLCGGHQGGGDQLAQTLSHHLNAQPVITSCAHHQSLPGVDVLGRPFGWGKGTGNWTGVASAIAHAVPVQVIQEAGTDLWQAHLPATHPFQFGWPDLPVQQSDSPPEPQARVWISPIQRRFSPDGGMPKVQWHPRVLWIGLGCERGTPEALLNIAITQVFQSRHLALGAIAGIATLDLKADEGGLLELCQRHQWPLRCFPAAVLNLVEVPNPSAVVEQAVGTASVAEAAAILAASQPLATSAQATSQPEAAPTFLAGGHESEMAYRLCVPKKVVRHPDYPGAVTLAVTLASQEYTGRLGQIALVGTGPGRLDQMTAAAKAAIAQADAVIGYSLYVDLIRPLLRPGQIIEALPITQEQQRADRAIALANWGLSVAVVSSGDCGIYAMAGLVLETLQAQGWDGEHPAVESFPGISALQASAARVGAPLMHDFCVVSLSDLLTPWPVIEQRLQAAAAADFVLALYNPKSQQRTEQIAIAQAILLQHRSPDTPVALVQSAYRPNEQITLTCLLDMLNHPINMLTTVIVGNQSTRCYQNRLVTPRGYSIIFQGENTPR